MNAIEKYKTLIEQIRDGYGEILFRPYLKDSSADFSGDFLVESSFNVSFRSKIIAERFQIVEYRIEERETEKVWRFWVVPAIILFGHQFRLFRKNIIDSEKISGIFTTKNEFFPKTMMSVGVILFSDTGNQTWLSTASSVEEVVSLISSPVDYSRKVYFTTNLDEDNFMPEHYNGELQRVESLLDRYESKKLKEIAEIIAGKNIPSHDLCNDGIPYLRARDIQNSQIMKSEVFVSRQDITKCSKQLLQEGDIVLSRFWGQHKVTKVCAENLPAVASNGLFIIRPFGVPEGYLYEYLSSETGKRLFNTQLSSIERGVSVPAICLKDLSEIRIPLFDDKTMIAFSNLQYMNSSESMTSILRSARLEKYIELMSKGAASNEEEQIVHKTIIDSLRACGWNADDIRLSNEYNLQIGQEYDLQPDIVLLTKEELLAVVVIKKNYSQLALKQIIGLYEVIKSGKIPFLVFTTGNYYEIHSAGDRIIKKMDKAPTKEYLLTLLNGKGDM